LFIYNYYYYYYYFFFLLRLLLEVEIWLALNEGKRREKEDCPSLHVLDL